MRISDWSSDVCSSDLISDYGIQLKAKQKLKGYYGDITEKQFKRNYVEASRIKGDTSQNLIGLLEQRLDMVVYRAKFAPTIFSARQIVSHGHLYLNGKQTNIAPPRLQPDAGLQLGATAPTNAPAVDTQSHHPPAMPEEVAPNR